MKLRTLIFWPHLICGVVAGLVVLMMCVTGALLTYERQLIAWSDRQFRSSPSPGAERLDVETLLARVQQAQPELTPAAITIGSAPDAPVSLSVPQRTLYADAYTGRLLGEGSTGVRRVMSELRSWHRWFAVEGEGRGTARAITGWSNVAFAFIVLSGMYLWLPRTWSWLQVKAVAVFRGGLSGKARDFNWHNVIGIWSAIPLFIVVVSAIPISFPWGTALVYRAVGEEPPAGREGGAGRGARAAQGARGGGQREGGADVARAQESPRRQEGQSNQSQPRDPAAIAGLNALWTRAAGQEPEWRTINIRIPASAQAPVVFAIDRGDGGQPHLRSTLTLSRSGEVDSYEAFGSLSLGRRLRNVMRFAHTGEVLGIPGQTVAGLVSAGGGVLVWTGLALAWRRLRAWAARRQSAGRTATVPARESAALGRIQSES